MRMFVNENLKKELKRKSLHLLTILYPVLYNVLPYAASVIISATVVIIDLIFETIRLLYPSVNKLLLRLFEGTYREKEKDNISTLIWTLSGAFLTILLFSDNKNIVTLSLLYLALGDSIAAVVGVAFGKIKLGSRGKSLEGSLAFFLIAFLCGLFYVKPEYALLAAFIAAAIEFLPLPLDDNFVLPIFVAGVLTIVV
ncbi:MAG: SEC59/DGK1/VTE5 family protein [Endomicrobia bacterium]|nr:SEC59/DGK1/VTE5 family protein [Endomicrobiia bacterium]MDW8055658.1 SEC59/DGK1/VTE5 family protein [Elusimicrobiota bacterium]